MPSHLLFSGRVDWIRTSDPLTPSQDMQYEHSVYLVGIPPVAVCFHLSQQELTRFLWVLMGLQFCIIPIHLHDYAM